MHAHEIIAEEAAYLMFHGGHDGFSLGRVTVAEVNAGVYVSAATQPQDGYMVGGIRPEIVVPRDERLVTAGVSYLAEEYAGAVKSGAVFIGGWVNDTSSMVHLDVSECYASRAEALEVAAARGEIAVWDVSAADEIRLADVPA